MKIRWVLRRIHYLELLLNKHLMIQIILLLKSKLENKHKILEIL